MAETFPECALTVHFEGKTYRPIFTRTASVSSDRCFEPLIQLSCFTSMWLHAMTTLPGGLPLPDIGMPSKSVALDAHLLVPLFSVQEATMTNTHEDITYFAFSDFPVSRSPHSTTTSQHQGQVNLATSGAIFGGYFERVADWAESGLGTDKSTWPPVLSFCNDVRNALFHGHKIRIRNPNRAATSWRGITLSPDDHGKPLFDFLGRADLIVLMLDLEDELNEIGAPNPLP